MEEAWANDFSDIPATLAARPDLREAFLRIASEEPIQGKVLEGGLRTTAFRGVLAALGHGSVPISGAIQATGRQLDRASSPHVRDNRVFAQGWEERLLRTQYSRCYNQAVLEMLQARGVEECYVPHSAAEDPSSPCSRGLAGGRHPVGELLRRLKESYGNGKWDQGLKVPNHPHCTHVVRPVPIAGLPTSH